jgi:hypothetical protein
LGTLSHFIIIMDINIEISDHRLIAIWSFEVEQNIVISIGSASGVEKKLTYSLIINHERRLDFRNNDKRLDLIRLLDINLGNSFFWIYQT